VISRKKEKDMLVDTQTLNSADSKPLTPVLQGVSVCKDVVDATGTLSILADVNLTLSEGQTMAIVGASGSGKRTPLAVDRFC